MTRDEAKKIGYPVKFLPSMMTVEQACTQKCSTCRQVMQVHTNAKWRFKLHKIRCEDCAKVLLANGENFWDAYYVY